MVPKSCRDEYRWISPPRLGGGGGRAPPVGRAGSALTAVSREGARTPPKRHQWGAGRRVVPDGWGEYCCEDEAAHGAAAAAAQLNASHMTHATVPQGPSDQHPPPAPFPSNHPRPGGYDGGGRVSPPPPRAPGRAPAACQLPVPGGLEALVSDTFGHHAGRPSVGTLSPPMDQFGSPEMRRGWSRRSPSTTRQPAQAVAVLQQPASEPEATPACALQGRALPPPPAAAGKAEPMRRKDRPLKEAEYRYSGAVVVPEAEGAVYADQLPSFAAASPEERPVPQHPEPGTTLRGHYDAYQHNLYKMAEEILGHTTAIKDDLGQVRPASLSAPPPAPPLPTHTPDPGHASVGAPASEAPSVPSAAPASPTAAKSPLVETSSFLQVLKAVEPRATLVGDTTVPQGVASAPAPPPPAAASQKRVKTMDAPTPAPSVKSPSSRRSSLAPPAPRGRSLPGAPRAKTPARTASVTWGHVSTAKAPPRSSSSSQRPPEAYAGAKRAVAAGPYDRPPAPASLPKGPPSAFNSILSGPKGTSVRPAVDRLVVVRSLSPGSGTKTAPKGCGMQQQPFLAHAQPSPKAPPVPQLSFTLARSRGRSKTPPPAGAASAPARPRSKGPPAGRPAQSLPLGGGRSGSRGPALVGSIKSPVARSQSKARPASPIRQGLFG